jgi:hypothetical protein
MLYFTEKQLVDSIGIITSFRLSHHKKAIENIASDSHQSDIDIHFHSIPFYLSNAFQLSNHTIPPRFLQGSAHRRRFLFSWRTRLILSPFWVSNKQTRLVGFRYLLSHDRWGTPSHASQFHPPGQLFLADICGSLLPHRYILSSPSSPIRGQIPALPKALHLKLVHPSGTSISCDTQWGVP